MFRSGLIVAASTLALLVGTFDTAEAQRRGGVRAFSGGGGTARGFSSRSFAGPRLYAGSALRTPRLAAGSHIHRHRHHRHGRHFRRGVVVGVPLGIYGAYSAYNYSATCDWLYRKAVITGNPYRWSRYEACLYGDY
jgi:hypothetical protein